MTITMKRYFFYLSLSSALIQVSANTTNFEDKRARSVPLSQRGCAFGLGYPRRHFFRKSAAAISGGLLIPQDVVNAKDESVKNGQLLSSFSTYKINPDASVALSPTLNLVDNSNFMKQSSLVDSTSSKNGGVLWLGEHHNSVVDHTIQRDLIQLIYNQRNKHQKTSKERLPMAIGLEQIQVQYQSVLDDFVAGKISETDMLRGVDWEKRWTWPYDGYRPIFDFARKNNISLVALNVNSEDLALVEQSGLRGLSKDQLKTYIKKDPVGFGEFIQSSSFTTYASYVIEPSYDLHKEIGLLKSTMSGIQLEQEMTYQNFFSGRILWDESMAGNAYAWTRKNPGGLMIGLIGADHVKFSKGVVGRYDRLVGDESKENVAVLLNPTLIDSRPPGSVSGYKNSDSSLFFNDITLQLRYLRQNIDFSSGDDFSKYDYTGGVLPLADYILISKSPSS